MRILFCGDRLWSNTALIHAVMSELNPDVVIEGEAPGADTLSREVAEQLNIPVLKFPANWKQFGRAAGPIRNRQMLDDGRPDLVVAFHNNLPNSKGTKNMLAQASKRGLPTRTYTE